MQHRIIKRAKVRRETREAKTTQEPQNRRVYLDYNATTPLLPEVISEIRPFIDEHFGNPSSSHFSGVMVKAAVDLARKRVSKLLSCSPEEVIFTSGGTESTNWAIKGFVLANLRRGNHVITSQVEHPATIEVCEYLQKNHGIEVTYLPVDQYGRVAPEEVRKAVKSGTILISLMHANNEVGTLQPLKEVGVIARSMGVAFHTDAAQSFGKIPTNVRELGVDLLTIAGHKLYAPKGIGALYIRKGIILNKFMHGAGQEHEMRAGTENIIGIVGLGKASELALHQMEKRIAHTREMRDMLHNKLLELFPELKLNGHPLERLPNTLSVGFPGIKAFIFLAQMKDQVAASAGSACHSGQDKISSVLKAMGVPEEFALGTVRFSTGYYTTVDNIEHAVSVVQQTITLLQTPTSTSVPTETVTHNTSNNNGSLEPQIPLARL